MSLPTQRPEVTRGLELIAQGRPCAPPRYFKDAK